MSFSCISYLEGPRPDETLGGMLGRAVDRAPIRSKSLIGAMLFGTYGGRLHLDLPKSVGTLAKILYPRLGLSADDLIEKTTMLPFVRPFLVPADTDRLVSAMKATQEASPALLHTLYRDKKTHPRSFRFCEKCTATDIKQLGDSWWRRIHQIQGIRCCIHHRCPLAISQFTNGYRFRPDYPIVEDAMVVAHEDSIDEFDIFIAEQAEYLLSQRIPPLGSLALRDIYMEVLKQMGYVQDNDTLLRSIFLRDVASKLGQKLKQLGHGFDATNCDAWPARLVLGQANHHRPIRHLCMMYFLGITAKDVTAQAQLPNRPTHQPVRRGPDPHKIQLLKSLWPAHSISIQEIAETLGTSIPTVRRWATANRFSYPRNCSATEERRFVKCRNQRRREWLCIRSNGEKNHRIRVQCWLSTHDGAWFNKHKTPCARGIPRVDWAARDAEIAPKIPYFAARIRAQKKLRRITILSLSRWFRNGFALILFPERLPQTRKAADALVETKREFVLRKIAAYRERHPNASPQKVRDRVSVPRHFTDDEMCEAMGYTVFRGNTQQKARRYKPGRDAANRKRWEQIKAQYGD